MTYAVISRPNFRSARKGVSETGLSRSERPTAWHEKACCGWGAFNVFDYLSVDAVEITTNCFLRPQQRLSPFVNLPPALRRSRFLVHPLVRDLAFELIRRQG
jgi:hypothetical protein